MFFTIMGGLLFIRRYHHCHLRLKHALLETGKRGKIHTGAETNTTKDKERKKKKKKEKKTQIEDDSDCSLFSSRASNLLLRNRLIMGVGQFGFYYCVSGRCCSSVTALRVGGVDLSPRLGSIAPWANLTFPKARVSPDGVRLVVLLQFCIVQRHYHHISICLEPNNS